MTTYTSINKVTYIVSHENLIGSLTLKINQKNPLINTNTRVHYTNVFIN